jgi:hypothetical protein
VRCAPEWAEVKGLAQGTGILDLNLPEVRIHHFMHFIHPPDKKILAHSVQKTILVIHAKSFFMAELKTKPTVQSVEAFLEKIPDDQIRDDAFALVKLMTKATGSPAKMWGSGIVGFGKYHYKYESGREGEMCSVGFSPRKQNFALYVKAAAPGHDALLKKLGKHKATKGCLYIKKLEDVNLEALESLIRSTVAYLKKKYPEQ